MISTTLIREFETKSKPLMGSFQFKLNICLKSATQIKSTGIIG